MTTKMLGVVICDDEPLVRSRLSALVTDAPGFTLLGEAGDGREAVERIDSLRPDLVLLDIRMPELDGFEVIDALSPPHPAVVFVTAYDQHALRAFDVHALDYLLKPVDPARFARTMAVVRERIASGLLAKQRHGMECMMTELRQAGGLRRLAVRAGAHTILLDVSDIMWIDAADDHARVHAARGTWEIRQGLGELTKRLSNDDFVRIHRSSLVNLAFVERVEPWSHGEVVVVMRNGQRLHASRTYGQDLRRVLQNRF